MQVTREKTLSWDSSSTADDRHPSVRDRINKGMNYETGDLMPALPAAAKGSLMYEAGFIRRNRV
jgi:hypothetical protein